MTERAIRIDAKADKDLPGRHLPDWGRRILAKTRARLAGRAKLVLGLAFCVFAGQLLFTACLHWLGY